MIALYFIFLGAVVQTLGSLWRGYVLTILWAWFIVPVFHLPVLTLLPAMGVALLVGFMTADSTGMKDEDAMGSAITTEFLSPLMALGLGWIIHLFM